MQAKPAPIFVEQQFQVSRQELWNAITQKNQMIVWFFENIPDFKPEIGFKTQFVIENEGRQFTHLWEIIEVIPEKKIVYRWKYKEYPGVGTVYFEIEGDEDTAKLTLTNLGLESFPTNIPEFKRESCQSGWNYFINQRLKIYLES
ncbi:MAG: SRPBCC domain-containing protein [Flavobacteriaceae bacterium]|nr:SRPBCC domain-containing protein [Flavobacteriaceae bacterium]